MADGNPRLRGSNSAEEVLSRCHDREGLGIVTIGGTVAPDYSDVAAKTWDAGEVAGQDPVAGAPPVAQTITSSRGGVACFALGNGTGTFGLEVWAQTNSPAPAVAAWVLVAAFDGTDEDLNSAEKIVLVGHRKAFVRIVDIAGLDADVQIFATPVG